MKQKDLFSNEVIVFKNNKREKKNLFSDYDVFVDKFKPKKTTDDCFTPKEVYDCVLNYVCEKFGIQTQKRTITKKFLINTKN